MDRTRVRRRVLAAAAVLAQQADVVLEELLLRRLPEEYRRDHAWALLSRGFAHMTEEGLAALVRRLRGRTVRPVSRWARLLAGAGLGAPAGLLFYVFYLMAAGRYPDPGPVLAGRPLPWLALQGLAVAAVAAGVATAAAWWRAAGGEAGGSVPVGERVRVGLLLAAGAVSVPWAVYWGLLVP